MRASLFPWEERTQALNLSEQSGTWCEQFSPVKTNSEQNSPKNEKDEGIVLTKSEPAAISIANAIDKNISKNDRQTKQADCNKVYCFIHTWVSNEMSARTTQ